MIKKIPANVILFTKIYLIAIPIFSLFRFILFLTEKNRIENSSIGDIISAFIMGIKFDIVISGYIILFPFILLSIIYIIKKSSFICEKVISIIKFYILSFFTLSFVICASDIPYFNQFFSRFSILAFQWIDSPVFVMKMVFQEPRYWLIIIPLIFLVIIFIKLIKKSFNSFTASNYVVNRYVLSAISILFLLLIFIGIRGRIEKKSPIRIGTAYFCNNPFLNQLGLNPNFTLIRSALDATKEENKSVNLIDNNVAILNVQSNLNISKPNSEYPILRKVQFDTLIPNNYNVILVIMESMSVAKMQRHGNNDNLTPFLDSISSCGYYFENTYTSGIHTMNGIFSTLFSFPALFRQHPMKESSMLKYMGIYSTLKSNGYSTIYFTTHDGQFDNVEGFLKANDCERVISKSDYPQSKVKTTLGVPDDYMFEFSIPIINELSKKSKPFFATFMTASDHGPYYLPEYFKPKTNEIKKQIIEYADFSLRKFIELASSQKWFSNTIFVFIADHGAPLDNLYEMSIDYHHTPLLFYSPSIIANYKVFDKIASQIDVFPSIMGLLQIPYYNNTLGIDLFRENRDYAILNADDKFGVISKNWLLIEKGGKNQKLYKYRENSTIDYSTKYQDTVNLMSIYARSNLQVFQYIKNQNKQVANMQ